MRQAACGRQAGRQSRQADRETEQTGRPAEQTATEKNRHVVVRAPRRQAGRQLAS